MRLQYIQSKDRFPHCFVCQKVENAHKNKKMIAEVQKRLRTESPKRGYQQDRFPTPPRPEFLCKVCSGVVKSPKECSNCGLLLCCSCWDSTSRNAASVSGLFFLYRGREVVCPSCGFPGVAREPSRLLRRLVLNLQVKCKHYRAGCDRVLPLGDVKTHQSGCVYKVVQCGNYMCGKTGPKADFFPVFRPAKPGCVFVCSQICLKTVNMIFLLAQNETEAALDEFYKAASDI